ncbi:MAG TPA: DUF2889 domain-containing protein, partial [Acidimicrobiales bacterium]|nr:DUF2889 domain-containing protein [Acidimicrobiales bacterium]
MRRTSSLDVAWPAGPGHATHMSGRARDVRTGPDGEVEVLAADAMTAAIGPLRDIEAIEVEPSRPSIGRLVGARGGRGLRAAIDEAAPDDRRRHTPLALLLDDIAGTSLVSGVAWSRHRADWMSSLRTGPDGQSVPRRSMVSICAGFRPGSSGLEPDGTPIVRDHGVTVPSLVDPDDPDGWHELPPLSDVALRRARRMDVWRDDDHYVIAAHFRDSCTDPDLGEVGVHEYTLDAVIDAATLTVTTLEATPRVLPYGECPAAAPNVAWLLGEALPRLRTR